MINGGFTTVDAVSLTCLIVVQMKEISRPENGLEGCMVGRVAYQSPWEIGKIDRELFGDEADTRTREEIIRVSAHLLIIVVRSMRTMPRESRTRRESAMKRSPTPC